MGPERQSALHRRHLDSGAHLQMFGGWRLPARYAHDPALELERLRDGAGVSDASFLTKLDLRGHAGDLAITPPARAWVLTPVHSLVTSPEPIAFIPSASVTDVSSVYSAILLAGGKSRQVLQKLTTLNVRESAMANGAARQARVAHVNATILRMDNAHIPGFMILNTRDVAEHVWDALLQAGNEFGAFPFGAVAQQSWPGTA